MFGHHDTVGITGNQAAMLCLGEMVLNNQCGADGGGSTDEHAGAGYDPDSSGSDPCADSGPDFSGNNAS